MSWDTGDGGGWDSGAVAAAAPDGFGEHQPSYNEPADGYGGPDQVDESG